MIHHPWHTLVAVATLPDFRLQMTFADGASYDVDLAPVIARHPALAALQAKGLFDRARLDSLGGYVIWMEDDLEMAADNLRNLAIEQAGGIGHERMWEWMHRNSLTQQHAADAIGISRRMLNYYLSGQKPIPKTVWLACLGWEASHSKRHAA